MAQPWDVSDQSPESIGVTLPGPVLLGFDSGLELSPHSYSSSYVGVNLGGRSFQKFISYPASVLGM